MQLEVRQRSEEHRNRGHALSMSCQDVFNQAKERLERPEKKFGYQDGPLAATGEPACVGASPSLLCAQDS